MPEGAYPRKLVPVARPGDVIHLNPLGEYREVEAFIAQPGVDAFPNGVTVSGNDENADNEATSLEMPSRMLGQFRLVDPGNDIPGDVSIRVDQGGQQSPIYTTKNAVGEYDRTVGTEVGYDGSSTVAADEIENQLTELYVWEGDNNPFFTFINSTAGDETVQDLTFVGYHYVLGPAEDSPPPDQQAVDLPVARVRPN